MTGSRGRFTQRGGIGLEFFRATWPFAVLDATEEAIELRVFRRHYVFPRGRIVALSRQRGFPTSGLRIEHTCEGYPGRVIFWTFRFAELRDGLEALGYRVRS